MAIKIKKNDIIWGYLGTILNSGMNILILPVILKMLPTNELGLWYTFTAIAELAMLLDFGFTVTISRNISYAWSGAKTIQKKGISLESVDDCPNFKLFNQVIMVSRSIYFFVSLIVLLTLSTLGTAFILSVTEGSIATNDFLLAWAIYIAAVFLNIYYSYWTPVLKGIGAVKQDYQSNVISKAIQMTVSVILLLLGYKLLAVSIGYFIGSISKRLIAKYMFYRYDDVRNNLTVIKQYNSSWSERINIFQMMWTNAYKQGLMVLAQYLTDKFSLLVCSAFFGLEMSAIFGLSMQLIGLIGTLGTVLYNTYLPSFNQLRIQNNSIKAYRLLTMSVGVQSVVIIMGGVFAVVFSNPFLRLIGSQSRVLPVAPFIVLLIFYIIHYNQRIHVAYIMTSNELPMFKAYLICATISVSAVVLCAWAFKSLGVWSMIIPMIITEAAYNGWKWPMYVFKNFDVTGLQFYMHSFRNIMYVLKKV